MYPYKFECSTSLLATRTSYAMQILYQEEFENAKGVIRTRQSKNKQHNGQKKKDRRTNNDQQSIHIKLKITGTLTPLNTRDELMRSERISSSRSISGCHRVNIATMPVIIHE